MPVSLSQSSVYGALFGDPQTAEFFTDSAEIAAMLQVEAALAKVQGEAGLIPADAAAFLHHACQNLQIDPARLEAETALNGVPVPALLAEVRRVLDAPQMTRWLHWGATSQDIIDTGLALRLQRLCALWDDRLGALIRALGALAQDHADLPMAARTYGQSAVPTSFGAVVASWGQPVLRHRARLAALRGPLSQVSLSGAAGTLSALGPQGPQIRAALAQALGLSDPGQSWHAERDTIAGFAAFMAGLTASLGKMAEDLILLTQSGIGEVVLGGAGGSSTMPQKRNPVGPSVLVALARHAIGLSATLQGAALHRQQRDGAAWFTEWLTLPQLCVTAGRAIALANDLAGQIVPDPAAMRRGLTEGGGLILAEALTFALCARMPRPEAEAAALALAARVRQGEGDLTTLASALWPDLVVPDGLGCAPQEARAFALVAARA